MYAPKTESSTEFEKHPQGACRLILSRIVDKGTVYNEKKMKDEHKVSLYFESEKLMTEGDFKGQPFLVIDNFNYSMYQNAHLCGRVEAMLGKKFPDQKAADAYNLANLIGKTVFATISYSEDGKWVNVMSIMPLPDGMQPLEIQGESYVFDLQDIDMKVFEKLSDRVKAHIQQSHEWAAKDTAYAQRPKVRPDQEMALDGPAPTQPVDDMDDIHF